MKIRSLTTTFFAALLCASSISAQKLRDVNDDVYFDGTATLEATVSKKKLEDNSTQNVVDDRTQYYSDEYVTDEVNYTAQMNRFHNPSGMGYYSPYNYGAGWDDPWYWNSANSSWGFNNGWGNNNNCCNNSWGNNNGWGNNNSWGNNSYYNNRWGNNNRWGSYYYNPYSAYNSYNYYNNGWGNNNNNWASYDPTTNTRPASSTRVVRTSDGNAGTSRNVNNNSYTAPAQNSNSNGNSATNGNTSNSGTNSSGRRTYNTTQTERSPETRSTPRQSSGSFNTSKPSNNTSSGRRSGR